MSDATLSILFVDDETRVLDGIRRALHRHRDRWSLTFVEGAADALQAMSAREHDIVITDMRMPGLDGAALLSEIAKLYPRAVRVVLSGQTDAAAARRAAHVAHRFLAKPIDVDAIIALLERLMIVRALLDDDVIARAVGTTNLIASTRDSEMAALCANPSMSPIEAAFLIRRSPILLAKTLQLSGSAFFAHAFHGTSIVNAVTHIGLEPLVDVVCDDGPCTCGSHGSEPGNFWRTRMRTIAAHAAEHASDGVSADDAFVAGLLHDIGRVFVADSANGALIASVSAYLLGLWGLPEQIVSAVRWQNEPSQAGSHRALAEAVDDAKRANTESTTLQIVR